MPRGNLLRHIFKHGPLSKHKDSSPREPVNNPQAAPSATSPVETTRANAEATSRLAKASAPVALQILPKIKEEPAREFGSLAGSLSSCSSSNTGAESATAVLAAQNTDNIPDPSTITTRDLVYAAIDEATSATHAHLDTLETTLALLETIRGLSETVEVLRREMKEKRKACQVAVKELAGFEEGVEKMHFADDGVVRGAR
ncbi:hypothetical protein TW65_03330 [Stemphylium lycopersici]|nr:hypothetical protein TW65_03330 [Stemphylium lycopersici]